MTDQEGAFSIEAEQSVLGGLLLDNSARDAIVGLVDERDFCSRDHRMIFRAIVKLIDAQQPADIVTVAEKLDAHAELGNAGGIKYLGELVQNVPSAANIKRYADVVRDRSLLRQLATASREINEAITNRDGKDAKALMDLAQAKLMALTEAATRNSDEFSWAGDLVDGVMDHIRELSRRTNKNPVTGLATGYDDLDKKTTGLHPGDLVIVAGRPSMGKTALSLNIAENVADSGKNVAFFSLEMTGDQLMYRLLASVSQLNQHRAKVGDLNEEEFKLLGSAAQVIRDMPIWLNESGELTVNELRAMARKLHRETGGLHLVVIDYLQLIRGDGRTDNRAQEVSEISRSLKGLAKELQVPVVALSQLNRGLEQRPNKRPIMSDLRDSGGIEQDADLILFIYRDEVYHEDSPDQGIAEIIIGKQRNGPTGTVHLTFRQALTRFENFAGVVPSRQMRQDKRASRAQKSGGNFRPKNEASDSGDEYVDF